MDGTRLDDLRDHLPAGRVATDAVTLGLHAHDWWPRLLMRRRAGEELPVPDAVVTPADRGELVELVRWCARNRVALVPFGAGTGVCGGAAPSAGAITVDLRRLDEIGPVDGISGTVTVEPGVFGQALEDHLRHRGWTLGHFPSSLHCSTIGGFLAVRSAGQASSFYGKLEDMVVGLEAVLADGSTFVARPVPSSAAGPDLKRLFLGGEGTTGIVVAATLRVWPAPTVRLDRGWLFPDVATGLAACRRFLRTGLRPHVFRLYDEADTAMVFGSQGLDVPPGCLAIVGIEGDEDVAPLVAAVADRCLREGGGTDLGPEPGEHWRAHRHDVAYRFADSMKPGGAFGDGVMLDTMEVAGLWSGLVPLYEGVRAALALHADLVLAHFSHVYPEGASIYFTFGAATGDEDEALRRYDAAWAAGQAAALSAGGTISHHHGVGVLRAPYLRDELGEVGYRMLAAVKGALDPDGLLNPGKLGLPPGAGS